MSTIAGYFPRAVIRNHFNSNCAILIPFYYIFALAKWDYYGAIGVKVIDNAASSQLRHCDPILLRIWTCEYSLDGARKYLTPMSCISSEKVCIFWWLSIWSSYPWLTLSSLVPATVSEVVLAGAELVGCLSSALNPSGTRILNVYYGSKICRIRRQPVQ